MFSILDIVRRDAATYYEFDTNNRVSRAKTLAWFAMFGALAGAIVGRASNDFLAGVVSAQAILVGFSFNVLFYLVANRLTTPANYVSLEHELRFARLSRLSDEVFDNVTYFNLVAIVTALAALLLLLAGSDVLDSNMREFGRQIRSYVDVDPAVLSWTKYVALATGLAVLVFLLCESIYTFLRAVGRVRFYFGMLKTMDADNQES